MKSANLSFMLEFKSDVIKDVSSTKMSHSFAAAEVLIAFSPFLLLLMGRQRCSMFLLKLLLKQTCRLCYQPRPIWTWVNLELIALSNVTM